MPALDYSVLFWFPIRMFRLALTLSILISILVIGLEGQRQKYLNKSFDFNSLAKLSDLESVRREGSAIIKEQDLSMFLGWRRITRPDVQENIISRKETVLICCLQTILVDTQTSTTVPGVSMHQVTTLNEDL